MTDLDRRPLVPDRFWSLVDKRGLSDCWEWQGWRNAKGYGMYKAERHRMAHRIAYTLVVGPIPSGLQIDHLCRNPGCVNPAHMEPVTNHENMMRGQTVAAANLAKTHCPQGHPYSPENTYFRPGGHTDRRCRTCQKLNRHPK